MTIRRRFAALGIALLACSPLALAQQNLVGTYKGSIRDSFQGAVAVNVSVILTISSAENGKIAGKLYQSGQCRGNYTVDGTYEGNNLRLTQSSGPVKDCGGTKIELAAKGDVLEGTADKYKLRLTRSKTKEKSAK